MNNLCDACLQLWLNWLQLWWSEKNKPLRNTGPNVLTSIITRKKKKTGERSKFRNEPEDSKSSAYFHAWLELLCQLLFVFRPTQFLLVSVCHHVWVCVCVGRWGAGMRPWGASPSPMTRAVPGLTPGQDRCKCHTHGRAHDCKHAALVHSAPSDIKTRCFHSKIISVTVKQIKKGNKSDKIKARIKSCRTE